MDFNGNNGMLLAEVMHFHGLIKDNMGVDDCMMLAGRYLVNTPQQKRWLSNDDLWEDFSYRASELGYKLKL